MTFSEFLQNQETDCHFTYCRPQGNNLQQGDLLDKTEETKALLDKIHPHYLREDYTHFIVLTQSCDLVRRKNNTCTSRYITLAAVRPLRLALIREIEKYQKSKLTKAAMACNNRVRFRVEHFAERFLNNNEPEYFYLHEQPELGFPYSSCAFLRLSISLRAYEHYDTCLRARILSLTDIFKAKLGWLVGNMYSRVGTEDWVPSRATQDEFQQMINDLLDELCMWVDLEKLKLAKKVADEEILAAEMDDIRKFIDSIEVKSKREHVLERVVQLLRDEEIITDEKLAKSLFMRMHNDPKIASHLK